MICQQRSRQLGVVFFPGQRGGKEFCEIDRPRFQPLDQDGFRLSSDTEKPRANWERGRSLCFGGRIV